jgi:hypothetical protein
MTRRYGRNGKKYNRRGSVSGSGMHPAPGAPIPKPKPPMPGVPYPPKPGPKPGVPKPGYPKPGVPKPKPRGRRRYSGDVPGGGGGGGKCSPPCTKFGEICRKDKGSGTPGSYSCEVLFTSGDQDPLPGMSTGGRRLRAVPARRKPKMRGGRRRRSVGKRRLRRRSR